MKLRCIIYSTDRTFWFKRDFGIIRQTISRAKGIEPSDIDFDIRYFPPPLTIPTYTDYLGNVKPDARWFKERCPAAGHNVVALHLSHKHAKRWGIKGIDGFYFNDPDEIIEFFFVANQGEKAIGYPTKSTFWWNFVHELRHGLGWSIENGHDRTHEFDYWPENRHNIEESYAVLDTTHRDEIVEKRNWLVTLLEKLRKKVYG